MKAKIITHFILMSRKSQNPQNSGSGKNKKNKAVTFR